MKRLFLIITFAFLLAGCGTVNEQFVDAIDQSWQVIAPEYLAYIEADEILTQESKDIRARTAETLTALIEEAQNE